MTAFDLIVAIVNHDSKSYIRNDAIVCDNGNTVISGVFDKTGFATVTQGGAQVVVDDGVGENKFLTYDQVAEIIA